MTTLEALSSVIGVNYPFDQNTFLKALIDQSLTGAETYDLAYEKQVDYAAMNAILTVILRPAIEQGGYKVSDSDKAALITVRTTLLNKYGLPIDTIPQPKLTFVRIW